MNKEQMRVEFEKLFKENCSAANLTTYLIGNPLYRKWYIHLQGEGDYERGTTQIAFEWFIKGRLLKGAIE